MPWSASSPETPAKVPVRTPPQGFDREFATRLPLRILLVEDNAVNQKLALLLLGRLGYRADTANDGVEALRSVRRQKYDVIFMDMHMPEMDGLEASRHIRQIECKGERPWIIALTANALQEDRKRCLEAGMDDFLTKPIQANDLRLALTHRSERVPSPSAPAAPGVDEWALPEYLREILAEDSATGAELIQMFRTDAEASIGSMEQAVANGNMQAALRVLHSLKGSCGQMGSVGVARLCGELEQEARAGDLTGSRTRLPELRAGVEGVCCQLETLLPDPRKI